MKSWITSRTVWLAILQSVAGIVVIFMTNFPGIGWLAIVKSIVDIALRFDTQAPIQ